MPARPTSSGRTSTAAPACGRTTPTSLSTTSPGGFRMCSAWTTPRIGPPRRPDSRPRRGRLDVSVGPPDDGARARLDPGGTIADMKITREIIVFDAADLDAVSGFWAALVGGRVEKEDDWPTVSLDGAPRYGVQLAPDHVQPDWPDGAPQQIHLDLYVEDINA